MQAVEKQLEAGGSLDKYEIEGPDRAELLQDLGEFQLASVPPAGAHCAVACCQQMQVLLFTHVCGAVKLCPVGQTQFQFRVWGLVLTPRAWLGVPEVLAALVTRPY